MTTSKFRRWVRFSLRTLLIFVTLIFVALGWYINRAESQRKAVLWIEANGGTVEYDHEPQGPFFSHASNRAEAPPDRYQEVASLRFAGTGVDYFHSVVRVHIGHVKTSGGALRDDGASAPVPLTLQRLAGLTHLEDLAVRRNVRGDLEPLRDMINLRHLSLGDMDADDFGPLAGMTKLVSLYMGKSNASDLGPLAGMTKLESLYMGKSNVSDLGPLANLQRLRWIDLDCPHVRDLRPLAKIPKIFFLRLENSKLDDLSQLLQIPNLSVLELSGVTVEDWSPLEEMTSLSDLGLEDTNITAEELEKIDALLREGTVRRDRLFWNKKGR